MGGWGRGNGKVMGWEGVVVEMMMVVDFVLANFSFFFPHNNNDFFHQPSSHPISPIPTSQNHFSPSPHPSPSLPIPIHSIQNALSSINQRYWPNYRKKTYPQNLKTQPTSSIINPKLPISIAPTPQLLQHHVHNQTLPNS